MGFRRALGVPEVIGNFVFRISEIRSRLFEGRGDNRKDLGGSNLDCHMERRIWEVGISRNENFTMKEYHVAV